MFLKIIGCDEMANYVNNTELLNEVIKSKERDQLTDKAIEMFQRMITESLRLMKYKNPMDKEDCKASAMLDVLLYWRNFDPDHPKANAFAYFTQYIKNGSAKGFNMLHPEIKKKVQVVRLSESNGITNI